MDTAKHLGHRLSDVYHVVSMRLPSSSCQRLGLTWLLAVLRADANGMAIDFHKSLPEA